MKRIGIVSVVSLIAAFAWGTILANAEETSERGKAEMKNLQQDSPKQESERPLQSQEEFIAIRNPRQLKVAEIPAERVPIGQKLEYKPNIAHLGGDELLLLCYLNDVAAGLPTYLYRSHDGGRTWEGGRDETSLPDGGEPYLSRMRDGTLLVTGGPWGYRSEDDGYTWSQYQLPPEFATRVRGNNSRNILELEDGSLLQIVDIPEDDPILRHSQYGNGYVARSYDGGRTWPDCYPIEVEGVAEGYPRSIFGEVVLWQARSGKIYGIARLDHQFYPLPGRVFTPQELGNVAVTLRHYGQPPVQDLADTTFDQFGRMKAWYSTDEGHTWQPGADLGDHGQMFHSILRLRDGRLLFTYTQRSINPPLGVRAVLGRETEDGFEFDFEHDIFMIDTKTPIDRSSGGGFGNTVQLDDGTLVTSYSYWRPDEGEPGKLFNCEVVRWRLP